jgi:hypothetical protein
MSGFTSVSWVLTCLSNPAVMPLQNKQMPEHTAMTQDGAGDNDRIVPPAAKYVSA